MRGGVGLVRARQREGRMADCPRARVAGAVVDYPSSFAGDYLCGHLMRTASIGVAYCDAGGSPCFQSDGTSHEISP